MVGYVGRVKMINAVFGNSKKGFTQPLVATPTRGVTIAEGGRARPLTPVAFDAMFGAQKPRKFVVPAHGTVREVR
jgi:hypothetical protein